MQKPVFIGSNVAAEYALFLKRTLESATGGPVHLVHALSDASYRAASKGGLFARLLLRLRMYGEYPVRLTWALATAPGGSQFVLTSNTFFMPLVGCWVGRIRGHRIVHLLYDLFPEALIVARGGALPPAGEPLALTRTQALIAGLMKRTFREASATVFIGDRLRSYAESRYGKVPTGGVIAVGSDAALFAQEPPASMPAGEWTVLYSGQMGQMHDWETLFDACCENAFEGLVFKLRGGGAGMRALQQRLAGARGLRARIEVGGSQPTGGWVQALESAPIGLITLRPGAEAVVFPSKTFSALQAGQALIVVAPESSDVADLVRSEACGWVVSPGDSAGLAALLKHLRESPEAVLEARRRAWHAGRRLFGLEPLAAAWKKILRSPS